MNNPAATALTVMLLGLAGLMAFGTASVWFKLGHDTERPDERPTIPVHRFRFAASVTGLLLVLLGLCLMLGALLLLPR